MPGVELELNDLWMYFYLKLSTIFSSSVAAVLYVLIEIRQHSLFTATLAILSGVMVATLCTTPIVEFWSLPDSSEHAIAGVLGITGRNLIISLGRAAKDPVKFWNDVRRKED